MHPTTRLALGFVLAALLLSTASARGSQTLYPLVSDWDQQFRIESRSALRDGKPLVSGTVWNTSSWSAKRIQLLPR